MMDRKQQLMQESLDGVLSPQEEHELQMQINEDPTTAGEYDRLQTVEEILREAPHERAPERLAMTIMARIAQTVKQQQTLYSESQDIVEASVDVAVQLVTVATLPMLVAASALILNAQADPELIDAVLQQVAMLMILVLDVMNVLLEQAEAAYAEDPELALALLAMIPPTLLALVSQLLLDENDADESAE